MATSTSWAQDVIICNLCDKPAIRFCNSCQTDLCLDCVGKHVNEFESLSHDIVPFQNRKIRLVLPECEFHSGQRCEAHCQQCHTPVCVKCFTGNHKGHDIVELAEIVEQKKEMVRKEMQDTESKILATYQAKDDIIKAQIFEMNEEFARMKTDMERLRKIWHQEVDDIFDKANNLLDSLKYIQIRSLSTLQSKIQNKIPEVKQVLKNQTEVLKSNHASRVYNFKSKLEELKDFPEVDDIKWPSLIENTYPGKELTIEIDEFRATLSQKVPSIRADDASYLSTQQMLDEAKVISTISMNTLYDDFDLRGTSMFCVGSDEAWINDGDDESTKIILVDIHGSLKDVIFTNYCGAKFTFTIQGELLLINGLTETIDIVKQEDQKRYITPPRGWEPRILCCLRSGDVLVHVEKNLHNKILRYRGQQISQEINTDLNGEAIFREGLFKSSIAENVNEDICFSDMESVKVLDRTGRVRFRYDGIPVKKKESFEPMSVVTDSLGQIIISDYSNNCLHIIDQNGKFLKCVDNCGLDEPRELSIDSEGRLWVVLHEENVIKVIKYLK